MCYAKQIGDQWALRCYDNIREYLPSEAISGKHCPILAELGNNQNRRPQGAGTLCSTPGRYLPGWKNMKCIGLLRAEPTGTGNHLKDKKDKEIWCLLGGLYGRFHFPESQRPVSLGYLQRALGIAEEIKRPRTSRYKTHQQLSKTYKHAGDWRRHCFHVSFVSIEKEVNNEAVQQRILNFSSNHAPGEQSQKEADFSPQKCGTRQSGWLKK
ncbi:MAG: hypothetical protein IPM82_22965 [Saprospiraceae bacterium]|nr:hypothetical protein [Saprospiraceae bacterium]